MKSFFQSSIRRTLFFILLVYAVCIYFFRWNNSPHHDTRTIIDSDGKGYYAYLPAVFIYKDLSCSFFYGKDREKIVQYFNGRFVNDIEGKKFFKVYCGEALLLSPFFVATKLLTGDEKTTGYEKPFQQMVGLAALFYFFCGLCFVAALLRLFGIKDSVVAFVLVILSFGTNLFYYTAMLPSMSHAYSFFAISGFIYFLKKYFLTGLLKNIFYAAAFAGIIFLIRPVNLLVFAIVPFLAGSFTNLKSSLISLFTTGKFYFAVLLFFAIAAIQQVIFYLQAGTFALNSYPNEGFYFLHPALFKVLFSFRKGWLVYSPVFFLLIVGLIFILRKSKYTFSTFLLFIATTVYFISAWWNWYYGPGFGMRPIIDFYAVFAIPVAFAFQYAKNKFIARAFTVFACVCILLNVFQSWQYSVGIIHAESMNREKYKYVFLKTGKQYYNCLGGGNLDTYLPLSEKPFFESHNDFEKENSFWSNSNIVKDKINPDNHCQLLAETEYSSTVSLTATEAGITSDFYLQIDLIRAEAEPDAAGKALVVISYEDSSHHQYLWESFRINDLPRKELMHWKQFSYCSPFPKLKSPNDRVKIYVWNPETKAIYIDNLRVRLYSYKQH